MFTLCLAVDADERRVADDTVKLAFEISCFPVSIRYSYLMGICVRGRRVG